MAVGFLVDRSAIYVFFYFISQAVVLTFVSLYWILRTHPFYHSVLFQQQRQQQQQQKQQQQQQQQQPPLPRTGGNRLSTQLPRVQKQGKLIHIDGTDESIIKNINTYPQSQRARGRESEPGESIEAALPAETSNTIDNDDDDSSKGQNNDNESNTTSTTATTTSDSTIPEAEVAEIELNESQQPLGWRAKTKIWIKSTLLLVQVIFLHPMECFVLSLSLCIYI